MKAGDGRAYFWTTPSDEPGSRTGDPLGLDGMRNQLADALVPCLTGRVGDHEGFFWTLALVRWASTEPSDDRRVQRFLELERLLKLQWAKFEKERRFSGIEKAQMQSSEAGEPSRRYRPLLKTARAQGLLGVHVGPLRALGLMDNNSLIVIGAARAWLEGVGTELPSFVPGNWSSLRGAFSRARRCFGPRFTAALRQRLHECMPQLGRALESTGWAEQARWASAARCLGTVRAHALLADEFCGWADQVRAWFDEAVSRRAAPSRPLPPRLMRAVPRGLESFELLRPALRKWPRSGDAALRNLAALHWAVFGARGYGVSDLWIENDQGRITYRPALATPRGSDEGSDCRWRNAVRLMRRGAVA